MVINIERPHSITFEIPLLQMFMQIFRILLSSHT